MSTFHERLRLADSRPVVYHGLAGLIGSGGTPEYEIYLRRPGAGPEVEAWNLFAAVLQWKDADELERDLAAEKARLWTEMTGQVPETGPVSMSDQDLLACVVEARSRGLL
jgi:hypothetical protein